MCNQYGPNPWTPERIATLRALWTEGKSASEIASALRGVTRNAVIGKVHRLGLQARTHVGPPKSLKSRALPRITRSVYRPAPKPKPKPAPPKPKPPVARVATNDPASLIALALLASADAAQRRRDGFRATERTR